ncbi:MAG: ABC transporter permease subunit [Alphaproteobacteria bacterium]|nr:ABC transporter permease subunit [Alphaproteobacteria bacterium]
MVLAGLERRRRVVAHLVTLAFVIAWAIQAAPLPALVLPSPSEVVERLGRFLANPYMWAHMGVSLAHVVAALGISFAIGSALALLAHYVPVCRLLVHGRISPFLNSFSGIGWTLLAVIWFGLNHTTVVFSISLVLIPFAIVNIRAGLDSLDPELLEMARSFGRRRLRHYLLVVQPALYPFMFATLRISFGVAWKVALTVELLGGNAGFGFLFNVARQDYDTPLVLVVIGLIIAFVYSTDRYVFAPLQARLARHYEQA